jgi:hypothetical protein
MNYDMLTGVAILVALLLFAAVADTPAETFVALPEGATGIAATYPGDKGIEQHPAVVFSDDFESYSSVGDLRTKWDVLLHQEHVSIAKDTGPGFGGAKSLLLNIPQQDAPVATGLGKLLTDTQAVLFLRWYQKFDDGWMVPGGSVHNGGSISSKYDVQGRATPGIRADGRNKFLVNFENENSTGDSPGLMNVYVYWPEQGDKWGDHFYPSGTVIPFSKTRSGAATFGEHFRARPDFSPELDRWYCYEFMVKANTPGQRDGHIAMWVDGKLIADFPNLRLRDVEDLKIDRFGVGLYIASNTKRANRKWYDNVVAATSYIGPVAPSK